VNLTHKLRVASDYEQNLHKTKARKQMLSYLSNTQVKGSRYVQHVDGGATVAFAKHKYPQTSDSSNRMNKSEFVIKSQKHKSPPFGYP
jgi:hypothetical protein